MSLWIKLRLRRKHPYVSFNQQRTYPCIGWHPGERTGTRGKRLLLRERA
jgi:hypothetical protein